MKQKSVLIVEDDQLIALDVEQSLTEAGYAICGVAASEQDAIDMAEEMQPDFAIVDIGLSPGDGRNVARYLHDHLNTTVLFATAQCQEVKTLADTGAVACLPKPYQARNVPRAFKAITSLIEGDGAVRMPDDMFTLPRAA